MALEDDEEPDALQVDMILDCTYIVLRPVDRGSCIAQACVRDSQLNTNALLVFCRIPGKWPKLRIQEGCLCLALGGIHICTGRWAHLYQVRLQLHYMLVCYRALG